jgi:magnesium transporter
MATALEIRERHLRGRRFESAADLAVVDDLALVGLARIEDILAAPDGTTVADLMDPDPPVIAADMNQKAAAWKAVEHGQSAIAVVDDAGDFVGLVPPWQMLAVLLRENDADVARLGGYLHQADVARSAMLEPVARRFIHRLPWLVIGVVGAMLAAVMLSAFEARLEAEVALAFFIPGIVYIADAVGTQTEAVVVRGLSANIHPRGVAVREVLTGALVGMTLAIVTYPMALLLAGPAIAFTVACSVFAATSVATALAMGLPWLLWRLDLDPAFGSGPLATVAQDVLSLLIYVGFATLLVS